MGGQQSSGQLSVTEPNFMAGLEKIGGMGTFQLWKRTTTGEEYEQYNIYSGHGFKFEKEIQVYEFRKRQRLNLVSVEHVDSIPNPFHLQGYQHLRVFTERVSLLLRDLQMLPLAFSIWILKQALVGFKALLGHFGYFPINDLMIGFNASYRVKVWISSNFGSNALIGPGHTGLSGFGSDEYKMLVQLFQTVERHTVQTVDLQFFKNCRAMLGDGLTFETAELFLSNFCIENRILLPARLDFSSLLGNIRPNHERQRQHGRLAERVKTYSDASCSSGSRVLKFNKPQNSLGLGSANSNPTSKIHQNPNTSLLQTKNPDSHHPLTFKKKHSSSVPKMTFRNNFASPVNKSKKFQFSNKRKAEIPLASPMASPDFDSKFRDECAETSSFLDSLKAHHVRSPHTERKNQMGAGAEKTLLSEKKVLRLEVVENSSPFVLDLEKTQTETDRNFDQQLSEKKERIKHLTSSCQPLRTVKKLSNITCKSGLPQFKFLYRNDSTQQSGLISKKPMTNSILFSQQTTLPTLQITAPSPPIYKKDLSDCQATNIYNSCNSIDPLSRIANVLQSLTPYKTTKFEDKVLSSYLPEYQHPAQISSGFKCGTITESIVEVASPRLGGVEERFGSERRRHTSKYSILEEKDISLSHIIKDEDSSRKNDSSTNYNHNYSSNTTSSSRFPQLKINTAPTLLLTQSTQFREPDSPMRNFFTQNKLDFQKYKQIMNNSSNNQIKQSITYEELGGFEKSKIMQQNYDNTPLRLDRYAKRGEVAKSMVMDESHLVAYQQERQEMMMGAAYSGGGLGSGLGSGYGQQAATFGYGQSQQQPMVSSIIMQYTMQEIQENDGEEYL